VAFIEAYHACAGLLVRSRRRQRRLRDDAQGSTAPAGCGCARGAPTGHQVIPRRPGADCQSHRKSGSRPTVE